MKRFGKKSMWEGLGAKGRRVLYSYSTPVVVVDGENYFVIDEWYSQTTTKHINQFLRDECAHAVHKVDPRIFPKLIAGEL